LVAERSVELKAEQITAAVNERPDAEPVDGRARKRKTLNVTQQRAN